MPLSNLTGALAAALSAMSAEEPLKGHYLETA
jgi:hypothetical protein